MKIDRSLVDLDEFDRKILAILGRDGRITYTDLAQRVGLSKTPCQQRVKRLVESGLITGFRAIVDPAKRSDQYQLLARECAHAEQGEP